MAALNAFVEKKALVLYKVLYIFIPIQLQLHSTKVSQACDKISEHVAMYINFILAFNQLSKVTIVNPMMLACELEMRA